MTDLQQYLYKNNFEKQLNKLQNKLKNKRIIIYGTGRLFQEIIKTFDLSKLNIIGICDRKYMAEDNGNYEFGYKIISYSALPDTHADCILIAIERFPLIINRIKTYTGITNIFPLVDITLKQKILNFLFKNNKKNNKFVYVKTNGKKIYNPKIKNLHIKFSGSNNYIEIHEPFLVNKSATISCGNNCNLIMDKNNSFKQVEFLLENNDTIKLGRNNRIVGARLIMNSNRQINIGNDCNFSYGVIFRTSDGHAIYDNSTKCMINEDADINVKNHVWITGNATILKGSNIPSNCIVGTHSVVNKQFEEKNCIIAGVPAKIIKRNINWDRRPPCEIK